MYGLVLLALSLVSGCASTQVAAATASAWSCLEPPPLPPPALQRAATSFFELSDIADWAEELLDGPAAPAVEEVVSRLRSGIEALRALEQAAADIRAYDVAETARMDLEDLLNRLIELGAEVSFDERRLLATRELDEPVSPAGDVALVIPVVLEDLAVIAIDSEDIALRVVELEAVAAGEASERAEARCLEARLQAFVDLNDLARMLEEDAVAHRIEAQQGSGAEAGEQVDLEVQLEAALSMREGCRRGGVQALEAIDVVARLAAGGADLTEFQELADELLQSCHSLRESGRPVRPGR